MKRKLSLLLILILLLITTVSATNVIYNGGFETGSLSGWSQTTEGTITLYITGGAQEGSYSLAVDSGSGGSGGGGTISQTIDAAAGDGYIRFYTKVPSQSGSGDIYVDVYEDGSLIHEYTVSGYSSWYENVHAISASGSHTYKFEVYYSGGKYGVTQLDNIRVNSVTPTAAFTGTPVIGAAPLSVTFTQTDTHASSYYWDFGDGSTSTSPGPVSHSYTSAGNTYTVLHRAINSIETATQIRTTYITTNATLAAAFSGTPVSGNTPLSVTFTDASTGSPYAWNWSFGDGIVNSTQNPVHSYTTAGIYTVTLNVTAPDGTAYTTKNAYVTATGTADHTGMAIGGRIYDSLALTGLSAVQMTLVNTTSGWTSSTYTNTTGYYSFNNLSTSLSNVYVVSAVKTGYLDTATTQFSLSASEVSALYADKSFGMEVIGSSSGANQGLGGKYAPNLVRFTIKYWYGEPIKNVNVTAQGFESTAGSGDFANAVTTLGNLFGFDFVTTPIQNTLMMGNTGDDGSITFWMVENVNYHLTFTLNGVELVSPMNVYPKEFEYPITVPALAAANSAIDTNYTVSSGSVNNSYSYLTISYSDPNYRTSSAAVIFAKHVNSSYTQPIFTKTFIGVGAANFTETTYVLSHAGDEYYASLNTVHTDFGTRNVTKLITIPGRTLDLRLTNTDYYAWISLIGIYFIAQMGGGRRTRDVAIMMTFFALFLTLAGWLSITTLLLQCAIMFAVLYYIRTAEDQ
jgi:PKD repeat protein